MMTKTILIKHGIRGTVWILNDCMEVGKGITINTINDDKYVLVLKIIVYSFSIHQTMNTIILYSET